MTIPDRAFCGLPRAVDVWRLGIQHSQTGAGIMIKSELTDLRRRIDATKWPEPELLADASQGVQLATITEARETSRPITTGAKSKRG